MISKLRLFKLPYFKKKYILPTDKTPFNNLIQATYRALRVFSNFNFPEAKI